VTAPRHPADGFRNSSSKPVVVAVGLVSALACTRRVAAAGATPAALGRRYLSAVPEALSRRFSSARYGLVEPSADELQQLDEELRRLKD